LLLEQEETMRYLIDAEFRRPKPQAPTRPAMPYAAHLRRDLAQRNLQWAHEQDYLHEASLGSVPAVLYREDEQGRHGNFLFVSYLAIKQNPAWARRLGKVHTSARRTLLSRDADRRELDSSNSSDALLMNIFCHPSTLVSPRLSTLLGVEPDAPVTFGYRPRVPLQNGRKDATEIDMRIGDLLVEAKLTESDFQCAPRRLIERYRDLEEIFDLDKLEIVEDTIYSYQLIRGVLAAHGSENDRFCVLCDARRPDLIAAWHRVQTAVRPYDLRCRLQLLTWQELAAALSDELQIFLKVKYGIDSQSPANR
jgi:hypothetical protein